MLQILSKKSEQIEIIPLPDYVTVKRISYANGKVVRVVFRDADEIIKIVRAIKSHLTPAAPDSATPCEYCAEINNHLTGCPGDQSRYAEPVS